MTEAELEERIAKARAGDVMPLVEAIPAARFLGMSVETVKGELVGKMRFAPHLIGNALIPALHGGSIGAFLESTAIFTLLREIDATQTPRTISITVEYLRSARTVDTFARAEIVRQGRRVATVRAFAWQEDRAKPVAAANAHFLLKLREEAQA